MNDWSDSQYHEYVQQNAKTINRFDIVLDALKRIGPQNVIWWARRDAGACRRTSAGRARDPARARNLSDRRLSGWHQTRRAGRTGELCREHLSAKAKTEEFFASGERIRNLRDRERLQQEIEAKQARRLEIAQELGVSSFTDNFVNPYDRLLVGAKEALSAARRQSIEAASQVAALDYQPQPNGAAALRSIAESDASKDTELTSLEANQNIRRTQLVSALSGLAPSHPGRRSLEKELADLDRERQKVYNRLVDSYSQALLAQRGADAFKASSVEQKLRAEVGEQSSQASWFSKNYQEGMQLGAEVEQVRKRIDSIQQRIDFLSFETKAPGFVRLFSAARPPSEPQKGGRKKYAGMALVGAILVGLAVPITIDTLDSRLRTPRDVEKILGFPPAAWILDRRDSTPEFSHEQMLRLASRILQDRETNRSHIFAFTSVRASGNTGSLVTDTAAAIKQLGVTVLAVEANAHSAGPGHRDSKSRGLASLLNGHAEFESAVIAGETAMRTTSRLVSTPAAEHPGNPRLVEVLQESTGRYSIVLLDLPPLLVSVDAEFLPEAPTSRSC